MKSTLRHSVPPVAALLLASGLAWNMFSAPPPPGALGPALLFAALIVFTTTFGLPAGGAWASLMPMTAVAAFLVLGLFPAASTVFIGAFLSPLAQHVFARWLGTRRETGPLGPLWSATAYAVVHGVAVLISGAFYLWAGGPAPLTTTSLLHVPQLTLLSISYLTVNYLFEAGLARLRGPEAVQVFRASLARVAVYEGVPLIFASLMAIIYIRLGLAEMMRFFLLLAAATLMMRSLGLARQRLERRVKELDSLQAVGQTLSASLNLAEVLEAAYGAVSRLMPVDLFFVALPNPETGEISFPLVRQGGALAHWPAQRAGRTLAEHLLVTGQPLLIANNTPQVVASLGLDPLAPPAASWLGAPLLSGGEALGAIVVQSNSPQHLYDETHRELLVTIAAQAALAIRNASLYARTDRSLARRVQELNSILHTTSEGILLLDRDLNVLAANRALADFLGVALGDLTGNAALRRVHGLPPLLEQIGYSEAEFEAERADLLNGANGNPRQQVLLHGPPERYVGRTLAAVKGREHAVGGWLLVFHDLTEERAVAKLRDEWAHMLVHDLRAPVAVLKGTLDLFRALLNAGRADELDRLLVSARDGVDRLLRLIHELLDINRLENGQLPLRREAVTIEPFLREVTARLDPLLNTANIAVAIEAEGEAQLDIDRELIARVLINLLDNAIKFTPNGGQIRVFARRPNADEPGGARLGVSDNGPGIALADQAQLFQKFHQVSSGGRRTGTGLGLAFCKLVVEAHGGVIGVQSAPGQGTTFLVSLPSIPGKDYNSKDVAPEAWGAAKGKAAMEHHLTRFLTVLGGERGYSDNTTAAYRNDLAQFADFLRQTPGGPVSEPQSITADIASGYVAELHRRNYAPSTIARKVAAVKSFFHYLAQTGAMPADLAVELDAPKVKKNLPKTLSREEVVRLLDTAAAGRSAKAIRDRALLRFLYATGMRVTEVVTLRIEDVSAERAEVQLRGRGNRGRAVPIPGETMLALVDYLSQARPQLLKDPAETALFVNHRGQKLTRQGLWLIIKEHAEAAGIADVTPHTLRHSFASHRLNDGADLKELQDLLGHANLSTTQVYATVSRHPETDSDLAGAPAPNAAPAEAMLHHAPAPEPETQPETEVV